VNTPGPRRLIPTRFESRGVTQLPSQMLVMTGDRDAAAERVQSALSLVEAAGTSRATRLRNSSARLRQPKLRGPQLPVRRHSIRDQRPATAPEQLSLFDVPQAMLNRRAGSISEAR
jgi:hypothetical protein